MQTRADGDNFDVVYKELMAYLTGANVFVRETRGTVSAEVRGPWIGELEWPYQNVVTNKARKVNHYFAVAEWLWMSLGLTDVAPLEAFNKNIRKFSDDGDTLAGAYGPMLMKGIPSVVGKLGADPDSRQGIIQIFQPDLIAPGRATKDVPCTLSMQFIMAGRRTNQASRQLDMVVTMRSNDSWLGLPYDVFSFTQIHRQMAKALNVFPGRYYHVAHSEHLYKENLVGAFNASEGEIDLECNSFLLPVPDLFPLDAERLARARVIFQDACEPGTAGWNFWENITRECNSIGWTEAIPYLMLLRSKWDEVSQTGNYCTDWMMREMQGRKKS